MEPRKITIVQTKNQKKSVIITSATTLGELKDDLRTNGINYDGMTFYEGLTKTELKTDESILPHDIEYKDTITNDLVFMLTNTEKKIKSGAMSRSDVYAYIRSNNLQDEVQRKLGKNFTVCKTADLLQIVSRHMDKVIDKKTSEIKANYEVKEEVKEETPVTGESSTCDCNCSGIDVKARAAIARLVEILEVEYDFGYKDEILHILDCETPYPTVKKEEEDSPYTDDEINKMFRGM